MYLCKKKQKKQSVCDKVTVCDKSILVFVSSEGKYDAELETK